MKFEFLKRPPEWEMVVLCMLFQEFFGVAFIFRAKEEKIPFMGKIAWIVVCWLLIFWIAIYFLFSEVRLLFLPKEYATLITLISIRCFIGIFLAWAGSIFIEDAMERDEKERMQPKEPVEIEEESNHERV